MAWNNDPFSTQAPRNGYNGQEKKEYKPAEPRILVNLGKIEAAIIKMSEAPQFDFMQIEKSLDTVSKTLDTVNKSLHRLALIKTCEHCRGTAECSTCHVRTPNSKI